MVKSFRVPAPNQELVLSAFQEEGWPLSVYDPIPPSQDVDRWERLKFTIKRLNAAQEEGRIHFYGNGTGKGICWEPLAAAVAMKVRRAA